MWARSDIERLERLPAGHRRLLATCVAAIPPIAVGVRLLGLERTRSILERTTRRGSPRDCNAGDADARAREVAWLVGIAARRGPVRGNCVHRALATWWLLRREGIDSTLKVGVAKDGGRLAAHAWIERGGVPLNDGPDVAERYAPFERDFARGPESER